MKPIFINLGKQQHYSFIVKRTIDPNFFIPIHYHPEIEIMLVLQGTGTRFIGNHVDRFEPGDLVMVGPNLPHVWLNDKEYYNKNSGLYAEIVMVGFNENIFGDVFLNLPELYSIRNLIKSSSRGIVFRDHARSQIAEQLLKMSELKSEKRIIALLELLSTMANSKSAAFLSSKGYIPRTNHDEHKKMDKIYEYILENYTRDIRLEAIADVANLTPTAFCRFFKKHSYKTFTQFLTELRIGYACRLLKEEKTPISKTSTEAGFNSVVNFNIQFKKIIKISPVQYRKNSN